ncbi:MAG: hypothetical protein N2652_01760 [Kiritimatiellae bacterium]|nr:hypothetical protein [Kiritimatiellia bacterium]
MPAPRRWPSSALAVVTLAAAAHAATWYVDDRGGRDDADGTSPERAWATLARVNRAALAPGDHVLFRRGGEWRGQLRPRSGAPGAPIVYGAYGQGPTPRLLGSVSMAGADDWLPAGPQRWRSAPPRYDEIGAVRHLDVPRAYLHTEGGAQVAFERATNGALKLGCGAPGIRPNHVQLVLPVGAVRAGEYWRLGVRALGPLRGAVEVRLREPRAPWRPLAPPAFMVASGDVASALMFAVGESCTEAEIAWMLGGLLEPATALQLEGLRWQQVRPRRSPPFELDADVGNIIFDGGARWGVKRWSAAELRGEYDFWYDPRTRCVTLVCAEHPARRHREIELALTRHIIDQTRCSWVVYEDLVLAYGAAHGIGGGSTRGITVRRCDLAWIGGGLQHWRKDGRPVRYGNGIEFWADAEDCRVEECRLWEIYDAALTNQGAGTNRQRNIVWRRNVVWNCEYSFEYWNRGEASLTENIRFEYNTCVDAGRGWGHAQRPDPNSRHLMFFDNAARTTNFVIRRNIFARSADSLVRLQGRDWTAALTMDENLWFQPSGEGLWWGEERVPAERIAEFLHQRGFDRRSVFADPRFVAEAPGVYRPDPAGPGARFGAGAPSEEAAAPETPR